MKIKDLAQIWANHRIWQDDTFALSDRGESQAQQAHLDRKALLDFVDRLLNKGVS